MTSIPEDDRPAVIPLGQATRPYERGRDAYRWLAQRTTRTARPRSALRLRRPLPVLGRYEAVRIRRPWWQVWRRDK